MFLHLILKISLSALFAQDATFAPLHFDTLKVVKEYNLTPSDSPRIQMEAPGQSYLKEIEGKWFLGVGAKAVDSSVAHFTQFVQVGGYPSLNHYYRINCYRKSLVELRNSCLEQVPQSLEEFDRLQTGDWYYYQGYLGFVILGGWGNSSPLVAVGPKISVEGGWQVYVEKKPDNKIYLEIRPTKVTQVGLLAGYSWFVGLETSIMNQFGQNGLAFILDRYQHEDLIKEFLDQRNLSSIQEKVAPVGSVKHRRIRQVTQFFLATPIFPIIFLGSRSVKESVQYEYLYQWDESPRKPGFYQRRKDHVGRIINLYSTNSRVVRYDNNSDVIVLSQEFFHNKANSMIINTYYDESQSLIRSYFPDVKFGKIPWGTFEMTFSIQVPVRTQNPEKEVDAYFKLWKNPENDLELIDYLQKLELPVTINLEIKGTHFYRRFFTKSYNSSSQIPRPPADGLPSTFF